MILLNTYVYVGSLPSYRMHLKVQSQRTECSAVKAAIRGMRRDRSLAQHCFANPLALSTKQTYLYRRRKLELGKSKRRFVTFWYKKSNTSAIFNRKSNFVLFKRLMRKFISVFIFRMVCVMAKYGTVSPFERSACMAQFAHTPHLFHVTLDVLSQS